MAEIRAREVRAVVQTVAGIESAAVRDVLRRRKIRVNSLIRSGILRGLPRITPRSSGCRPRNVRNVRDRLYRELRRRAFRLPIVFLRGDGDIATAVWLIRAGAADFLEKPFKSAEFLECVENALQEDERLSPVYGRLDTLSPARAAGRPADGAAFSTRKIAETFGSSAFTVRHQRTSVLRKMHVRSVGELTALLDEIVAKDG